MILIFICLINIITFIGNLALSRALGDFVFKKNEKKPPEEQIVTGIYICIYVCVFYLFFQSWFQNVFLMQEDNFSH